MQKHIALSPAPIRRQRRRRHDPRGPDALARPLLRGAAGVARIRHARRRGAGPAPRRRAWARYARRPARRGRGRPRFASLPPRARREGGRDVVPLRPRSLERAHAHADQEPRSRRRAAAARGQRAAIRRGAVRARARAHERAPAPRRQRSRHARRPQLEGEGVPRPPLWPAGRRLARDPRAESSGPISSRPPNAGSRATN